MVFRKKKQLGLLEDYPVPTNMGAGIASPTSLKNPDDFMKMDQIPEAENEDLDINIAVKNHGRNVV